MPTRQSLRSRGSDRGRAILHEIAREAEAARIERGSSYAAVGRALGIGGAQVARMCRAQSPALSIVRAVQLVTVLGLDLSVRAFPTGPSIRDAGQIRLLERLRSRVAAQLAWRTEVPVVELPESGTLDRRAWDAVIAGPGWVVAVEAETRAGDIQAIQRRIALKQRDGAVSCVLLLLADTRHHRAILSSAGQGLISQFPVSPRRALGALAGASLRPGTLWRSFEHSAVGGRRAIFDLIERRTADAPCDSQD